MPAHHVVLHQQQIHPMHHHHDHIQHSTAHPPPPIATKQLITKPTDLQQPHSSSVVTSQSARQSHPQTQHHNKYFVAQQQQDNSDLAPQTPFTSSLNVNEIQNKSIKATSATGTMVPHSVHPQVSISPSMASASMAAVAASTLSRHTNSPFAALLAAAAGAPSPSNCSSVLRYAESPVAHYLERDNGDFIVQETPKHIVECVEKDNGEFSVIERIYQSPPSVLHIHDDEEDDEKDDRDEDVTVDHNVDDNDSEHDGRDSKEEIKESLAKSQKKNKSLASSPLTKEDVNNHCRSPNKTSIETRKTNRKSKHFDNSSCGNEIVDFVSISSDSEEEEFISHEPKDLKITTEKSKKNESTSSNLPSPPLSVSSQAQCTSSTPTSSLLNTEAHAIPSTSQSALSSNATTNAHLSGTRKKSSKNTITVLSDVQLNLNEYLDLVGNIIASSKVAAQRRTFTSLVPIPLVKIEKEEPMDDYIESTQAEVVTEEPSPPMKANKQETEDITDKPLSSSISSNKSNNISQIDQSQHEREEKKPQVMENIQDKNIAVNTSSSLTINSSQVTSVIRMATTSQHHQQQQLASKTITEGSQLLDGKVEAEDLSPNVRKLQSVQSKTVGHTPAALIRKGPKKLVIKPKSTRAEALSTQYPINDDQLPTTSSKILEDSRMLRQETLCEHEVQVKNEPITSIAFENSHFQQQTGFSILEQHLTSKEPILVCKEEKPCIQEATLPTAMKVENHVNDDARVLYDFATSKKCNADKSKPNTFPSASSLFANNQRSAKISEMTQQSEENYDQLHTDIETSSYSSQSAMDARMTSDEHSKNAVINETLSLEHNATSQAFSDFPFNYLYNGNNNLTEQVDVKNSQQLVSFYQNATGIANKNNNTNKTVVQEDSSSSKNYSDYHHPQPEAALSQHQWFNNYHQTAQPTNAPSLSANVNGTLNGEFSTVVEAAEVGKYLDLDACKRERNAEMAISGGGRSTTTPPPLPSSSTSCSFTGATENSMAGISSAAATLNIRTDEKMPAKGEISEQESNCDIDNSWSQPVS